MLPPTKLKCHIHILNIVLLTVDTSWFDMLLINDIFEEGKEKGLEESDPKPYRKHNAERSKETRQSSHVCKELIKTTTKSY